MAKGPKRRRTEEDMRRQQREASQRYYEKNAEAIRQKQREKYRAGKSKRRVEYLIDKIAKLQAELDELTGGTVDGE